MRKKILFILLAALMLGLIGYVYLNKIFLPTKLKGFITSRVATHINRPVSIEKLRYSPIKGILAENITILQSKKDPHPFVAIKEISFNVLLIPLLKDKTIIIPQLRIASPNVSLTKDKNNQWNFADLLKDNKPKKPKRYQWFVKSIKLTDGTLTFIDKSQPHQIIELFHNIRIMANAGFNLFIDYSLKFNSTQSGTLFQASGQCAPRQKIFSADGEAKEFDILKYLSILAPDIKTPVQAGLIKSARFQTQYKKGTLLVKGDYHITDNLITLKQGNFSAKQVDITNATLKWNKDKTNVVATIEAPEAQWTTPTSQTTGSLRLVLKPFIIKPDEITGNGDAFMIDSQITWKDKILFQGSINALDTVVANKNNDMQVRSDLKVVNGAYFWDKDHTLLGDFSTKNFIFTYLDDRLDINSQFQFDEAQLLFGPNKSFYANVNIPQAAVSYENKILDAHIQASFEDAVAQLSTNQKMDITAGLKAHYRYNPDEEIRHLSEGKITITQANLTGVPKIDTISDIQGTMAFRNDQFISQSLKCKIQNTPLAVAGKADGIMDPTLDVKIRTGNMDLTRLWQLFPEWQIKTGLTFKGQAKLSGTFKGPLNRVKDADIVAAAQLTETEVTSTKLDKTLTGLSAQLAYKKDLISWTNLTTTYNNKKFQSAGQIVDFSRPIVDMKILGDKFVCNSKFSILNQAFRFLGIDIKSHNSWAKLTGDLHMTEGEAPAVVLKGPYGLNLADLNVFLPQLKDTLKPFNIDGLITGNALFKGQMNNWRDWQLTFDGTCPLLYAKGKAFTDTKIKYAQRDRYISDCLIDTKIYEGGLQTKSTMDLSQPDLTLNTDITISKLNLKEMRKDVKTKNSQLSGYLSLIFSAVTPIDNVAQTEGAGYVEVRNGYLFQWKLLQGMSSVLLIPEFKNWAFSEGESEIRIKEERCYLDNLKLSGDRVNLSGHGWIDQEKNINFEVIPKFSSMAVLKSDAINKIPSTFLTQTDGYITIFLTGTLDKPSYRVERSAIKIIEKTTGMITEGVGKILQGILPK